MELVETTTDCWVGPAGKTSCAPEGGPLVLPTPPQAEGDDTGETVIQLAALATISFELPPPPFQRHTALTGKVLSEGALTRPPEVTAATEKR